MKKIFIMTILFLIFIPSICTATETTSQDVLQSQQEELNISSFIKEAQKYTQNTFKDIDVNELFTSAIWATFLFSNPSLILFNIL